MLANVFSGTTLGLEGVLVQVEVDVAGRGFPTFTIVGLPNKAVDEAKDRVRTAVVNTSFDMPDSRITVNLAPADIPKIGSSFDLPIAVGILAASGVVERDKLTDCMFVGELSLEGKVREVPGVISLAILAKEKGISSFFVPEKNAPEAALIPNVTVYPVSNLLQIVDHLCGKTLIEAFENMPPEGAQHAKYDFDFADVKGQEHAKRALEIAAAGFHNVHLKGVPGAGKTMLSRAFPSILPHMDDDEILEVSKIYSVSGMLKGTDYYLTHRPFRAPHHTTSRNGLIGGGTSPKPGEISLAHRGVLFLDEFPEFPRDVLEAMRQPLEDGIVTISRASGSLTFPSRFLLIAASNPCPCGYLGHPKRRCTCIPGAVAKYKKRLSGPMLDRIDLHVSVAPVEEEKLVAQAQGESSNIIRIRVMQAYERQKHRFADTGVKGNNEMTSSHVKKFCSIPPDTEEFLTHAIKQLSLSARSYFKVVKVSQTISDLAGSDRIESVHIAEALQYRVQEE